MLDVLADDQALSLRAVAREVGIAATSVYLHFADRDALVLATLERCHSDLMRAIEGAETSAGCPAEALRARTLLLGNWAQQHTGLYKVLYESTINQRVEMRFKQDFKDSCVSAVQRCVDAGLAPRGTRRRWPSTSWPPCTGACRCGSTGAIRRGRRSPSSSTGS